MRGQATNIGDKEFILLMAVIMSLLALTIDAMLPALDIIGESLNISNQNDNQLIISSVFLGLAMGLMLYGPIADSFGRKKSIYLGIIIFLLGDLLSLFAQDFPMMIAGRILQGFGAAACRVVSITIIRDKFSGKEMARVMSLIMMSFIMVPALAPALGQLILWFAPWQGIFILLLIFALCSMLWLHCRLAETLTADNRIPFSFKHIKSGVLETLKHPTTLPYTIAAGLMFGAFIGYLNSAQQVFQQQYQVGELFVFYFGVLAVALGVSSFINSKLVMLFPLEAICAVSISILTLLSTAFFFYSNAHQGQPEFSSFMTYLVLNFCCFGLLFGSFNVLAVQPLGHIAGIANSAISTLSTLISAFIGTLIGQLYDGTVLPLVLGFAGCGVVALLIVLRIPQCRQSLFLR